MKNDITFDNIGKRASREESFSNLVPIEAAYFYSGMRLDFNVYVKANKSFSLLCGNIAVTDSILKKLDAAEDSGNLILVSKKSYREIILGAAKNAEHEGIEIDWESVHELANNPPSPEDFIEEHKNSEILDVDYIPYKNVPDPINQSTQSDKSIDEKILHHPAVEYLVNHQDAVQAVIDSINEIEDKDIDEDIEEIKGTPDLPEDTDLRTLGFTHGPKPRSKKELTSDEILEALSFSYELMDKAVISEEHIKKIEAYNHIATKVREIFINSAKHYKFNIITVEETAVELTHLVRTSKDLLILQCMRFLRENEEYLVSHTLNVACLNALLGKWLGFSRNDSIDLVKVALIHDIGEQLVPKDILFKPSKLTREEYNIIKRHSLYSYRIAMASGLTSHLLLKSIKNHHEKINGSGYPDGLKGNDIPLYARITAVSDTLNALITKKPYQKDYTILDIIQEFSTLRDNELDSKLVNVLIDNVTKLFIGKRVKLANGTTGSIVSINSSGYDCPMILTNGQYLKTNKYNKVVEMDLYFDN